MSYEEAKATALLATDCVCCGRALLDAASVEAGVGPVCRKKYGYGEIEETVRVAANALIHEAALEGTDNARREEIAKELDALGAETLAAKIRDRFMKPAAKIWAQKVVFGKGEYASEEDALVVWTKYAPEANFKDTFKNLVDWRDRAPVIGEVKGEDKFLGWGFRPAARPAVWKALKTCFAGEILVTPKGSFVIPAREGGEG